MTAPNEKCSPQAESAPDLRVGQVWLVRVDSDSKLQKVRISCKFEKTLELCFIPQHRFDYFKIESVEFVEKVNE